jgi:hypothetical protein
LTWLREHGCEWDERTCVFAAHGGHLEVLQWVVGHGCPWVMSLCAKAAEGLKYVKVAQWVRAHPGYDELSLEIILSQKRLSLS